MPGPTRPAPLRIDAIDATRGVACVLMVLWHATEAWCAAPLRGTRTFEIIEFLGGLAAPWFFWLAGLAAALTTPLVVGPRQLAMGVLRGIHVIVAGCILRFAGWLIDHGALLRPANFPLAVGLALALGSAFTLTGSSHEPGRRRPLVLALACGCTLVAVGWGIASTSPRVLAQPDVLHGIGAALLVLTFVLAVVGRCVPSERSRAVVLVGLAACVGLASPRWHGRPAIAPVELLDWVARTGLAGSQARFPLFPWLGHALSGAAIGSLLRAEVRPSWLTNGALGFGIFAALAFEGSPLASAILGQAEALRPIARLAFYGSAALAMLSTFVIVGPRASRLRDALNLLGRHSLFVYGSHIQLIYGLAGLPLRRQLGFGGLALAVGCILIAEWAVVGWLERERPQARPR